MRVIHLSILFRTANLLCTAVSIKPGDRVMVILPTIPEYWLMQAACLRTGTAKRYTRQRLGAVMGHVIDVLSLHISAADVLSLRLYERFIWEGIGCLTNHRGGNELHFSFALKEHVE